MAKNLVIVESPAKAKTIQKYLGRNYVVKASFGHVRDLPKSTMGVTLNGDVEVKYLVPKDKKDLVKELQAQLKKAETLWLATDLDREGEAIAWHLAEALKAKPDSTRRVTFSEITKDAIQAAFSQPRDIEMPLVDAQQARRIIDRFVGYRLSPVLWDSLQSGSALSAGRVQSVALRLVVDREREIEAFEAEDYFSIWARLQKEGAPKEGGQETFDARLVSVDGDDLVFTSRPRLVLTPEGDGPKASETVRYKGAIADSALADRYLADLQDSSWRVADVKSKDVKRRPTPPFTTSTLQQESARKLGYSASRTMRLAQILYEGLEMPGEGQVGLITYMRTDSVNMSEVATTEIGEVVRTSYGERYHDGVRTYKTRSQGAQEAHEAIRPTSARRTPDAVAAALADHRDGRDLQRMYRLIWQRAVASQMTDAVLQQVSADIEARHSGGDHVYVLRATGQTVVFDGFLRVYHEGRDTDSEASADDTGGDDDTAESRLPELHAGDPLSSRRVQKREHQTKPPPRYTEASLVKKLEELGIGRPSTYAPTLGTIKEREYVRLESKRFEPTEIGTSVSDFLAKHFPEYVDYSFTATMEADLDEIAEGRREWKPEVRSFHDELERRIEKVMGGCPQCGAPLEFRTGFRGRRFVACTNNPDSCDFSRPLGSADGDWEPEPIGETCPECGKHELVKKRGRYGQFIACSGYPECTFSRPLDEDLAEAKAHGGGETCPECGEGTMQMRRGRFGAFLGCSRYPDCKYIKRIEQSTGVKCPKCGEGDLVARRSKKGKTFYGCNKYPDCDFVAWEKPHPVPCPECGGLLAGAGATLTCTECKKKFPREAVEKAPAAQD